MSNNLRRQEGVTLVEVLISLVILLIVFLGLIQASILSIQHNLRNEVRDEAARIASEYMAIAMATQINTLAGVPPPAIPVTAVLCVAPPAAPVGLAAGGVINRGVRNSTQTFNWAQLGCYTDTTYSNAQVSITVSYTIPGDANQTQTTVNSIVRRQ